MKIAAKTNPKEAAPPTTTAGVRIARENRAACEQLADEQRGGLMAQAMSMIYRDELNQAKTEGV